MPRMMSFAKDAATEFLASIEASTSILLDDLDTHCAALRTELAECERLRARLAALPRSPNGNGAPSPVIAADPSLDADPPTAPLSPDELLNGTGDYAVVRSLRELGAGGRAR